MAKYFTLAHQVLKLVAISFLLTMSAVHAADDSVVVVGGTGADCIEDPGCVNRLHPDLPMLVSAEPSQTILFHTRDARDALGASLQQSSEPDSFSSDFGRVHPITGPVYINGASAGDVLKVTIVTCSYRNSCQERGRGSTRHAVSSVGYNSWACKSV